LSYAFFWNTLTLNGLLSHQRTQLKGYICQPTKLGEQQQEAPVLVESYSRSNAETRFCGAMAASWQTEVADVAHYKTLSSIKHIAGTGL
jgi:hypothetical protein